MTEGISYEKKSETKVISAPCQNCGRLVKIIVPFIGCVFCGDCMGSQSAYGNWGTEDFTPRDGR